MTEYRRSSSGDTLDRLLGFAIPPRNARGRIVRLGTVVDKILAAHDYPPIIRDLLAEALVLTALMGGLLKHEGSQLTLQAQTEDGVVGLLVCDYFDGELRGYVRHDGGRLAAIGPGPSLEDLFGTGHLAITFEPGGTGQRYQGIVPLEGASLAEAVEAYFERSEQVPTLIRAAIHAGPDGCIAGGILLQHLADGEEGRERLHVRMDHADWNHVAIMAGSISGDELADPALPLDAVAWRLFHEEHEVRVQELVPLARGCRCSVVHFEEVLARFPKEDRRDMRNADGVILVDCAFCSREFAIQD
jgi:molecular chaperone Hsp33